jgi:hypothetical protein
MENTCKNCECFALMCPAGDECLWGVCKKPVADMEEEMNGKKEVVFKWAEETCSDFKSRQETRARHLQKLLESLKRMLKI